MQTPFTRPPFAHFLFEDTRSAWFWLLIRLYVGYEWLMAGIDKLGNEAWIGVRGGEGLRGFIQGSLAKTAGAHPDVASWYAWFLKAAVLPHPVAWSLLVSWGEVLVGAGLILGIFTGIAAFFGVFMNLNYLLAGTVSINPILFALGVGLLLAWRVAGRYGLDRFLLPLLGTPWQHGKALPD